MTLHFAMELWQLHADYSKRNYLIKTPKRSGRLTLI